MTGLKTRIETPFVRESLAFYVDYLGMTVLQSWDDGNGAILGLGPSVHSEAFLELAYTDTAPAYRGLSLQFRVDDLSAIVEKLRGRVAFRGPTPRPWGSTYLYLDDPTGIQVILYEGDL
ncbi:MAG: VOC family protein [Rhodothermaceae bacterium]|nr:VOC family protein [Rhodothermaceae bacterium]